MTPTSLTTSAVATIAVSTGRSHASRPQMALGIMQRVTKAYSPTEATRRPISGLRLTSTAYAAHGHAASSSCRRGQTSMQSRSTVQCCQSERYT